MAYINKPRQAPAFDQMLFPNDIEGILLESQFTPDMLVQAGQCRQKVLIKGLTRFIGKSAAWRRPVNVGRVILVVGQVESDPSLKHGVQGIRTNVALLQAVCQANADAYVVYKPHPAVLNDMKLGGRAYQEAYQWFDEIVGDVSLCQLLPKVNEVHVMSSLAGFEALLRGKKVSSYAHSFYSGWGLTHDMVPMLNRHRQLSLDELVAGAMYCFPRYMNRLAGKVNTADKPSEHIYSSGRSGLAQAAARV